MDSLGLKCQRCSGGATVHMTEMADGRVRESHLCDDHAREAGVSPPTPWPGDDVHTTLEVTAKQLEHPEDVVVRFPDGFEINLRDMGELFRDSDQMIRVHFPDGSETCVRDLGELLRDRSPAVIEVPQERAREPRSVMVSVVSENRKDGS